jgi:rhamnosyltransferase
MKLSIIIPTFNGGTLLVSCFRKLLKQKTKFLYEIIIIDSESQDGSIDSIRKINEKSKIPLKIIQISQKDFNHGATRNKAIEKSVGEIISLITQDSIPADNHWVENIIKTFIKHPDIIGLFGKHIRHKHHPKIIDRDLKLHFDYMASLIVRTIKDHFDYSTNTQKRQLLHFFSNNNSAILRKVWKRFPFPHVTYGEDQLWAKKVIEEGYSLKYCEKIAVKHSHDFSLLQHISRKKIEIQYFQKFFNYKMTYPYRTLLYLNLKKLYNDIRWCIGNKTKLSSYTYVMKTFVSNILVGFEKKS